MLRGTRKRAQNRPTSMAMTPPVSGPDHRDELEGTSDPGKDESVRHPGRQKYRRLSEGTEERARLQAPRDGRAPRPRLDELTRRGQSGWTKGHLAGDILSTRVKGNNMREGETHAH